jgi:hypothetical protein
VDLNQIEEVGGGDRPRPGRNTLMNPTDALVARRRPVRKPAEGPPDVAATTSAMNEPAPYQVAAKGET